MLVFAKVLVMAMYIAIVDATGWTTVGNGECAKTDGTKVITEDSSSFLFKVLTTYVDAYIAGDFSSQSDCESECVTSGGCRGMQYANVNAFFAASPAICAIYTLGISPIDASNG